MDFILGMLAVLIMFGVFVVGMKCGYEVAIDKAKRGDEITAYGKKWQLTVTEVKAD